MKRKTTLAGVPKWLWMVARGLLMILGVSFCVAGFFQLLPGGFSRLLGCCGEKKYIETLGDCLPGALPLY